MLTRDRPAMAARAVQSFRNQTYANKRLLIYDNGIQQEWLRTSRLDHEPNEVHFRCFWNAHRGALTTGTLRNEANGHSDDMPHDPEVLIHWDDDDVSHPSRIAEQVALLQASGADAVGYNEVLFCDTTRSGMHQPPDRHDAWLYRAPKMSPAIGSSLCYWRKTWEAKPFPDRMRGEDYWWMKGLNVMGVSSMADEPRLVCSIHAGNAANYPLEDLVRGGSLEWKRAPEWDAFARERMAL